MLMWKKKLHASLKPHLERKLNETLKHFPAYKDSNNPSLSQLWVGIASLSREIFDLNLRLNYLEQALKQTVHRPKKVIKKVAKKRKKKRK